MNNKKSAYYLINNQKFSSIVDALEYQNELMRQNQSNIVKAVLNGTTQIDTKLSFITN